MGNLGVLLFCQVVTLAEFEPVAYILDSDIVRLVVMVFLDRKGGLQLQFSALLDPEIPPTRPHSQQIVDELFYRLVGVKEEEGERFQRGSNFFEGHQFDADGLG